MRDESYVAKCPLIKNQCCIAVSFPVQLTRMKRVACRCFRSRSGMRQGPHQDLDCDYAASLDFALRTEEIDK